MQEHDNTIKELQTFINRIDVNYNSLDINFQIAWLEHISKRDINNIKIQEEINSICEQVALNIQNLKSDKQNILDEINRVDNQLFPIPLERQYGCHKYTIIENEKLSKLECEFNELKNLRRSIYANYNNFIEDVIIEMSYLKHKLIKYELDKHFGISINDNIFNNMIAEHNDLLVSFNYHYPKFIRLEIDDTFKYHIDNLTCYNNLIMRKKYNYLFDIQYNLPASTIAECVNNNNTELWNTIFTKFLYNKEKYMPKI